MCIRDRGTIVFNGNGSEIKVDKAESPVQENAPPSVAAASPLLSSSQETSTEVTVYITETGSKYHSDGCQYLKKSQIAISLDEAKKSYEPCSKCHPPQ